MPARRPGWPVLAASALALAGCGGGGSSSPHLTAAPQGIWGDETHMVAMAVTASGAGLTFGCADAAISQPLTLDSGGHFDATGTFTRGEPLPVNPLNPLPAHFTGTTDGRTMAMTMSVAQADGTHSDSHFTFVLNDDVQIGRCL